ncbi:MAG: glycosyltransferase [Deltaproteobacteria bacterium]|nr:glycosyltransferase [Deltaproteobacteria bacterium]MBW2015579.1 glycosyltransferase [Deltaproteobacteria bacterium]MBW2127899.1 glycosyltransferase [Deltaproteobacteria bacterium]MBW2304757.1 glycosyltransferase [Deltaproteobacteria bacterium]
MALMGKIAYLAPEIPALSATFIFNEILGLEKRGFKVVPISVHRPGDPAWGEGIPGLMKRTCYLYQQSRVIPTTDVIKCFMKNPFSFFSTWRMFLSDARKIGLKTRLGFGLLYRFFFSCKVAEILKGEGCRHLHAHFAHVPADIAMYASGLAGIPFTFTAHANDLFQRAWLLREKVARAKACITISKYNKRFLMAQGAEGRKIQVVRCGVRVQDLFPKRKRSPESPYVIGSCGRLVEKKGMDVLIRALGLLKSRSTNFRLEIVGDGPLREALGEMAIEEHIRSSVIFKGPMYHDEVLDWLSRLDLFVLACRRDRFGDQDGIPVALMEAMAAGVPVVSTGISGIGELIEDGKTGLLARAGDPVSLYEKIRWMMESPLAAGRLARAAKRHVGRKFNEDANLNRLAVLFMGCAS